jgi:MoaD family protein
MPALLLREARVLLVGAGGLGAPAALALAEAGVGTLGLCDFDRVELSNLHRQVVYRSADVGRGKVEAAADRLRARVPALRVEAHELRLGAGDGAADRLAAAFDLVLEGTDSFEAKFACNDAAVRAGRPFVSAGCVALHGTVVAVAPGGRPCYRCLFEAPPDAGDFPTCEAAGVLGAVAGVVGALMAAEGLRLLAAAEAAEGAVLHYDALAGRVRRRRMQGRADCPSCGMARRRPRTTEERTMAISVHIPTPLRKYTAGKGEVSAAGQTVGDALDDLEKSYPGLKERLCDESGKVRRFVNIFANDEDIRALQDLATPLKDGDEISIVPAIAGGGS